MVDQVPRPLEQLMSEVVADLADRVAARSSSNPDQRVPSRGAEGRGGQELLDLTALTEHSGLPAEAPRRRDDDRNSDTGAVDSDGSDDDRYHDDHGDHGDYDVSGEGCCDGGIAGLAGRRAGSGNVMLSTADAADRLGITTSYVNKLLREGKLSGVRASKGDRQVWRISEQTLESFERQRAAALDQPAGAVTYPVEARADQMEWDLIAARQQIATQTAEIARLEMMVERDQREIGELRARLATMAEAIVKLASSYVTAPVN